MLRRPVLDSICPFCRLTLDPSISSAAHNPPRQPWAAAAAASRLASTYRQKPSRMVLSDRVAQPASSRQDDSGDRKPRRRAVDGPFAGMNRTVANIDPMRRIAQSRVRGKDGGEDERAPTIKSRFKALRMHRALKTISYGQRMTLKDRVREVESFEAFDLLPSVQEAVLLDVFKDKNDIKPTPVQRLAIPALLGQNIGANRRSARARAPKAEAREEFLLAAETGSGKTLAYLLPSVNALKVAEAEDEDIQRYNKRFAEEKALRADPKFRGRSVMEPHPTTARPRVIVLVPTAELVDQVGAVAKKISHYVKFRSEKLSANFDAKIIERRIYDPKGVDVVIATPHLLASMAESDPNVLSRVSHLIVDEADSLFDRSFSPVTTSIMDRCMPSLRQLILCSATIPRRLDTYMATKFPAMKRITTPNLHAIPRRVQLGVIDASKDPYRNNKNLACADAIWSIGRDASAHEGMVPGEVDVKRIMVFVNEREKTQEVADFLVSKGVDAVALHRDTPEQRQSEMLATFMSAEPLRRQQIEAIDRKSPVRGKRALENTKVIVATDLASRGIDTLGVRHVVLYDVPHTTIDFIHRLGRAGRMGRRGRGIVIMGKDDRRDIVSEVKESMFMGQALV
ncbi:P-loop containing nucleoside triphosphate hydrolase protein [Cryphonectria parasitica EP155]|uniref:RNA helicase n=1 Tax=Cryphonectria parasitica (strain ATCC 38755 / EP155) TaxID=660469 RepID=A0A9P4YAM1_CRYP1|nr:P-loop containing nucleoside triphosphate hydrolase protein [Cryphonectria parasitica EP155]KAF3769861.1 P-loop containing nucleoside triphosphate hydrolase protein [Cryphonectria parasitica EP155]